MDGGLIAQAVGAFGQGALAGRENTRRREIEDQQLAVQQQRFEAERLMRESMLTNAQRSLEAQQRALQEAAAQRAAAAQQQEAQYAEAVQALVARGVPEPEARVIARDNAALRERLRPAEAAQTPWEKMGFGSRDEALAWERDRAGAVRAPVVGGGEDSSLGRYVDARGGFINDRTGKFTPVDGLPERPGQGAQRPMTEGQRKAQAFLTQAEAANQLIEELAGVQVDPKTGGIASAGRTAPTFLEGLTNRVSGAGASNYVKSEDYRRMMGAALRLSDAWLRYTSGAAVPEPEVRRFAEGFIPAPGDDPQTLRDKAEARRLILRSLRQGVGQPGDVDTDVEARMMTTPNLFSSWNLEPPPGGR